MLNVWFMASHERFFLTAKQTISPVNALFFLNDDYSYFANQMRGDAAQLDSYHHL